MNILEATFRIITPMFMSGANQTTAELRAPSIKGVLRFWWRALAYSRLNGDLEAIHAEETQIFGSTERGASFHLRICPNDKLRGYRFHEKHQDFIKPDRPGARYLAYGLMDVYDGENTEAGKLQRPCIRHNQNFTLHIRSPYTFADSLIDAIKILGLIGNLGSRSRRGFGSITLNTLRINGTDCWKNPDTLADYKKSLWPLIARRFQFNEEPVFTSFTEVSNIFSLANGTDPIHLINLFGLQMQRFRSWGHHGKVNGEQSEQNFKKDHDWFKHLGNYRNETFHPRRVVFGLPHNYGKDSSDCVNGVLHERRASPLFVHVHEYSPKSFGLFAFVLRAEFLPDDEEIESGGKLVPQKIEWPLLYEFLNGRRGHRDDKSDTPYFPDIKNLKKEPS